jgi:hypothetical protein
LISTMLDQFAGPPGSHDCRAVADALAAASGAELDWALQAGLGPLLRAQMGEAGRSASPRVAERLLAADLTARVLIQERVVAALDAIDACNRRGVPVTLLKGISLSHFQYSAPHLRPMTDADLLVPENAIAGLEHELLEQGYWREGVTIEPGLQHVEPVYHPRSRTRIELHSRLFPLWSPLQHGTTFASQSISRESIDATFHGRPVLRLSAEFQLVYLASAWNRDLSEQGIHPSFLFGLFDAVALVRPPFDWDRVLEVANSPLAAASLDVLLACVGQRDGAAVPRRVCSELRRRHRLLGRSEVAILAALVNGYLLRGRPFRYFNSGRIWTPLFAAGDPPGLKSLKVPWYVAFPPNEPRRFDAAFQWDRLRRWTTRDSEPGSRP